MEKHQQLIDQQEQEIISLKADIKALVLIEDLPEALAVREKWTQIFEEEKDFRNQLKNIAKDTEL